MRLLLRFLIVLVLVAACADEGGRYRYLPPDAPHLQGSEDLPEGPPPVWSGLVVRIATFNVLRLFDLTCDSGRCGPGDFEALPTSLDFTAQTQRLADAIRELDADVVLLEEVESSSALTPLFERLRDEFTVALLAETGGLGSIDVGVLANASVVETVSHRDEVLTRPDGSRTSFARDFFEVHLALSAEAIAQDRTEVIVFAAHFKSKSNDDPGRRLAEAEAARRIVVDVAGRFPEALVVMGGDLNDTIGSQPIEALETGGDLLRVASDVPFEEIYTYTFGGRRQAIDHLFVAVDARGLYVPETARSFHDPGRTGFGGSDHAALRADFWLEIPRK